MKSWICRAMVVSAFLLVGPLLADPSGTRTGSAKDAVDGSGTPFVVPVPGATASEAERRARQEFEEQARREPLAMKLADSVGQNRISINLMWTLVAGFLVMLMQAGFALVETGLCRAKNSSHTMFMNFFVYPLGMAGFWIAGFALMFGANPVASLGGTPGLDAASEFSIPLFGKSFGLFATTGFFLEPTYDVGVYSLFLFQMVFMDTAATIPTGAMAERWSLKSFYIFALFMSMVLYPIFGNWAWGGGWLSTLGANFGLGHGYVDFAGSGVVHAIGGVCALVGAKVLGPRLGKYNADGAPSAIPAHHLPMALLGAFILAFGWFGFNAGSTLGVSGGGLNRVGIIATVTMLAGSGGAIAAALYIVFRTGRPDPTMVANGMLAGLVAITAGSGFVSAWAASVIGVMAGLLVSVSVEVVDRLHIDDPVGAISVHGVGGLFGVLAAGIFADGTANYAGAWNGVPGTVKGALYGDWGQLGAQVIGVIAILVWSGGLSLVFFWLLNRWPGMRVPEDVELDGLDVVETGMMGYPSFPTVD